MEHILDINKQTEQLHSIFQKIRESNTILFLGAGASVGEKRYLSREIIEYYEGKINKKLNEPNITKWIDILSADEHFSRNEFDNFVADLIQKLSLTGAHRILATIPWREIITTNYDLLVERAYDEVRGTHQKIYDLKTVKNVKQYNYKESNTEVKYVKLNGCIQDKSLYPLAFSADDFQKLNSYYKLVLNDLKNISPEIQFLSVGYSFSDAFAKEFLEKFDSYNYRDKKWIINVDPFPNESSLPYYTKNRICIVKCSFQDFFSAYEQWEVSNSELTVRKKGLVISNSKEQHVIFPSKLLLNLEGVIKQLNSVTKERFIKEEEFYKGEEPTFNLITRGVDVVKTKVVTQFIDKIDSVLKAEKGTFLPIFFVTGDFGIGKSTFTLRLIYELEKKADWDLVAFEILDFSKAKKENLIDLVKTVKSKNLIFFCDEVEVESSYKTLIDIQRYLSIEQFQDCNVVFLVPIRENILEKFKQNRHAPNSIELKMGGDFERGEIDELLEKLRKANLVNFRDAAEKKELTDKLVAEYDSDSFISLMAFITNGRHENDLISCYHQLSPEAQRAFLFTALVHKYKLLMPASWLKQNISMDWDEFISKIVKAEGKGILIQEIKHSHGTQPDLFFRTKHPLIAERLVARFIPNKDKQFQAYEQMLKKVEPGRTNSYLVNDLLKAFNKNEEYNTVQIDKLFDAGYTKLSDDPYYLLNYSINLQGRRTAPALKRAIEYILYAESLLDYRNHKFIHRRAVLNFELAKLYKKGELHQTIFYLNEAKELFITKQLMDPFSSFSYVDYIKLLIWELENIEHDEVDEIQKQILIEDLFELANRTVTVDLDKIDSLHTMYAQYLEKMIGGVDYKLHLDEIYDNERLRPYACILLFNYYTQECDFEKRDEIVGELEYLQDNFEVIKFLFKYYGRNLYNPNIRVKFLRLSRENPQLEKDNPLRFYYFNFIAESYNGNYFDGKNYLSKIETRYHNLNPEFHFEWMDSNGEVMDFDAKVIKNSGEKYKAVKMLSMQLTTRLAKGSYEKYPVGSDVKVRLHFFLYGLIAEIVDNETLDFENEEEVL